jgi:hypothetical protein
VERSLYLGPLTARLGMSVERRVVGCRFWVGGLALMLFLGDPRYVADAQPKWLAGPGQRIYYRPDEIRWSRDARYVSIRLRWERPRRIRSLTVGFRWEPPGDMRTA